MSEATSPADRTRPARARHRFTVDLVLLSLLVFGGYFVRMSWLPVLGEEGRRARGAINMIETGDWVVVRQGGIVFPDRPPMSNWLIALTGLARGEVDRVAIRLPSTLAILLTTLWIYGYCRLGRSSRLVAVTAAAAFATVGQVLQLGRAGESEAVFTLFVASSLLIWHLGYTSRWPSGVTWSLGYGLAALGALTKGLQAPIYFVMATAAYLIWKGQWRRLVSWSHALGLISFTVIVGAWQLPYYLATDWTSVIDTWFGVVGPRLGLQGLLRHALTYPFETLGALLPWSFALLMLGNGTVRRGLRTGNPQLEFVLITLAVTYPTVWLSQGAKSRYYMPLYPLVALLIGFVVESWVGAPPDSLAGRIRKLSWRVLTVTAVVVGLTAALPWLIDGSWSTTLKLSAPWTAVLLVVAVVAVRTSTRAAYRPSSDTTRAALLSFAFLLTLFYAFVWGNQFASRRVDLTTSVTALRAQVPDPGSLVSLGPVDSRFAFHYRDFVPEVPWPTTISEVPPDLDYFCMDRRRTDNAQTREAWRGMKIWTTPATLPFQWEEIGRVSVDPKVQDPPAVAVIVGRVLRDDQGSPIQADQP